MAKNNWSEATLRDLVDIKHGFAFQGEYFTEEETGDILLTPGNFAIGGGYKGDKIKYYFGEVPDEYVLSYHDLIVTMTDLSKNMDTLGYSALVPDEPRKRFLHNQRLGKVLIRDEKQIDKYFLYYLLRTDDYRNEVKASASGSVIRHTSPDRIRNYKFLLPPLPEQRAIAGVLGALDDKIELNRRMNRTLESMARAVFRQWFIGNKDAKDWEAQSLEQHIQAEKGLSYKGEGLSKDGGIPMHNLNSVYEGGGYKYEGIKYYTSEYRERHILHPGDIIVTNTEQGFEYLLIGFPAIVPKHFGKTGIFSHHIYRVRVLPTSPVKTHYLYFLLMTPDVREQIIGCTNGTTVNMLSVDGLRTPKFKLPPKELIDKFEEFVTSIFEKMELIYEESRTLASLRDTLLPKLMRGEVRVKGI